MQASVAASLSQLPLELPLLYPAHKLGPGGDRGPADYQPSVGSLCSYQFHAEPTCYLDERQDRTTHLFLLFAQLLTLGALLLGQLLGCHLLDLRFWRQGPLLLLLSHSAGHGALCLLVVLHCRTAKAGLWVKASLWALPIWRRRLAEGQVRHMAKARLLHAMSIRWLVKSLWWLAEVTRILSVFIKMPRLTKVRVAEGLHWLLEVVLALLLRRPPSRVLLLRQRLGGGCARLSLLLRRRLAGCCGRLRLLVPSCGFDGRWRRKSVGR